MNGPREPSDALSPAERQLSQHLELLRTNAPVPPAPIVAKIVRTARWQRTVRRPLLVIGALAAAVGDGIRLLLGSPTERP